MKIKKKEPAKKRHSTSTKLLRPTEQLVANQHDFVSTVRQFWDTLFENIANRNHIEIRSAANRLARKNYCEPILKNPKGERNQYRLITVLVAVAICTTTRAPCTYLHVHVRTSMD